MKTFKFPAMLIILFITSSIFAQQEIGKILSPSEAQKLFGNVTIEKEIPVSILQNAVSKSADNVSLNIVNNNLFVMSDSKILSYPSTSSAPIPNVYYTFSKSMVQKFIDTNPAASTVKVQMRGSVLTIDNGAAILEFSMQCPPYCLSN